ncbi:MAG: isoleucine--tRNA ligase [bacterium]|nr:isoleucine--tRNA ligase [bacterium]
MDYSKTLNLPKTDFPMRANLSKREFDFLKFWEEIDLYRNLVSKNSSKSKFILHDGPPYANGNIHMGHALNKILKDIIIKFKFLDGFNAPYIPGWDCHGLPIELKVTKNLKEKNKTVDHLTLRRLCREYADKFIKIQKEEFKRLGVIGDWDNPYATMSYDYEADILENFGKLVEKGLIYKGLKSIHWCPSCKTALAEAELEYKDHSSPSIFVKFKLENEKNTFIVIWTTTPWTIPSNMGIALHPDFEYVKVKVGEESWILAKELLESVMKILNVVDFKIIEKIDPKSLENKFALHPFLNRKSQIILGTHVTLDQGTGAVHTAPGHGKEDFEIGMQYGLEIFSPVNEAGEYTDELPELKGINVFDANSKVIEILKEKDALLYSGKITHSYPHCWRCKGPIIFRATEQWFMDTNNTRLKNLVLEETKKVNWLPRWGEERFSNMIENRAFWCLSRQRAWGVPIPALYCSECNETVISPEYFSKLIEIVRKESSDAWFKYEPEKFLPDGLKCEKCGSTKFRKETDILDVWFDSGSSWFAVAVRRPELNYPVDIYLEGSDQYRGWFQASMWPSAAINDIPPYRTVITHGFMLNEQGLAMSKSQGTGISPEEINKKFGADILRLWVSSENYKEDMKISDNILNQVAEVYKKIRNTFRFMLGNLYDFNPESDSVPYSEMDLLDKWILSKLHEIITYFKNSYETYEFHQIYHKLNNFFTNDLSAQYLDIIKGRLYTLAPDDKKRRSTQTALYQLVNSITISASPILSFTCEEIFQSLKKDNKSVFLQDWPEPERQWENNEIIQIFEKILELKEKINPKLEEKRQAGEIGLSLDASVLLNLTPDYKEILKDFDLREFLIVSQLKLDFNSDSEITIDVKKASGEKCPRCWKISQDFKETKEYDKVCVDCADSIEQIK